jgi:branched-chain amino acid transport system substrate-binding protein
VFGKRGVQAFIACAVAVAMAGCGSVDTESAEDTGSGGGAAAEEQGPIKVGLVIPQSGVYAPLGEDMKAGWELYLSQHGGKLGGREVETVVADEGEGPDTGVPALQKTIQQDQADVVVGLVNSATALGVKDLVTSSKKLLLVANAGANDITGEDTKYIWRTSFTNEQVAYAIGKHLAGTEDGKKGAYAIAADYAAGEEAIAGFKRGFQEGGGKLVGEAKTPFGTTQDFQPFLSKIRSSGAGAVYAFYAGAEAVSFVKQYSEFGLADRAPLYGSGFLTEGGVLKAQGKAAAGIRTSLHYATALDNPANTEFAKAYEEAAGRPATVYAVQTWDAASVLDKALAKAKGTSGDELATALEGLGEISDSPRGAWKFEAHSPSQDMYLREVEAAEGGAANTVVDTLGNFAPKP